MKFEDKLRHLRVINYFDFDGPYSPDREKDANFATMLAIRRFIRKYDYQLSHGYSFIIKYDNDIYSYLAFKIIMNAVSAMQGKIELRILGKASDDEEKEYFKDINHISFKNAKKLRKKVLLTGFHPICNVDGVGDFSNDFTEIYNPIAHFTPYQLGQVMEFYVGEKSKFYNIWETGYLNGNQKDWGDYFDWEIFNSNNKSAEAYEPNCFWKMARKAEFVDHKIILYKLSGTEEDFGIYDNIINTDLNIHTDQNSNAIFLYEMPTNEENRQFIEVNLAPYLSIKNRPTLLNEVVENHLAGYDYSVVDYKDCIRKEEDNEDSNC